MTSTYHSNNSTPNTPQELLDLQDNTVTELQAVLFSLADMTPADNHQVALVILGALRDWHADKAKELAKDGDTASLRWAAEATLYQVALRNINSVNWD